MSDRIFASNMQALELMEGNLWSQLAVLGSGGFGATSEAVFVARGAKVARDMAILASLSNMGLINSMRIWQAARGLSTQTGISGMIASTIKAMPAVYALGSSTDSVLNMLMQGKITDEARGMLENFADPTLNLSVAGSAAVQVANIAIDTVMKMNNAEIKMHENNNDFNSIHLKVYNARLSKAKKALAKAIENCVK